MFYAAWCLHCLLLLSSFLQHAGGGVDTADGPQFVNMEEPGVHTWGCGQRIRQRNEECARKARPQAEVY